MSTCWITELPELVSLEHVRQLEGGREALPLGTWIIRHHQPNVTIQAVPALEPSLSKGDLYVTESRLVFFSATDGKGIALEYPAIGIHAIARQPTDHAPCVYCQVDGSLAMTPASDDDEDDKDDEVTEVRFIPDDFSTLDVLFEAISECTALHPDADLMEAEGDDNAFVDGQFYTGDLDPQELSDAGQAALAYLDSIVDAPVSNAQALSDEDTTKDQFADAD
ncbi:regulator of volume decrease after cellular swelling-domain-containing protein [Syncephalis fuscata]|nr:regulator of volume decrease after cellular swelling-domain-containing protein [Syncephalis fuscata]